MRLLDLVEQEHGVRAAAHGLGQLPAFLVADVAGRRADEPGDRVPLLVLGHVEPHHRPLVVEHELGERAGELGLADAGRAEEDERADRPVGVLEAGARAAKRVGHRLDRLLLADDALVQALLHVDELLDLPLEQARGGDPRPRRDDRGDVVLVDLLLDHRRLGRLLALRELLLELGENAVADLGDAAEIPEALLPLGFHPKLVDLLLDLRDPLQPVLLARPARGQLVAARLRLGELALEGRAHVVGLVDHRRQLDLDLADAALRLVELDGRGVDLHAQARCGLVDQVDRLVGKEPVADVAVREHGGCDQRGVPDLHAVVGLVALLEPAQDRDRVGHGRLADEDRLEAALERGVLLDVLAVLVERRRPDRAQLAAGEHGLQQVGGVDGTLGGACADDRVQLVDEEDDVAGRVLDLLEDGLEPFLELAAVLRSGEQRADVERPRRAFPSAPRGHRRRRSAARAPRRSRSCRRPARRSGRGCSSSAWRGPGSPAAPRRRGR